MKINHSINKVVFLSTFPPTQCGIATYTQDTINAITDAFGASLACEVCDISERTLANQNAQFTIHPKIRSSYYDAAKEINKDSSIKLVHIQHEFGLFGGKYGNFLLDFLETIKTPVVYTFHSVIPNPDKELMSYVRILTSYSSSIIVMTQKSKRILIEQYGIDETIITCVPHGTHIVSYENPLSAKQRFNIENRTILSTFGLLGSGKSIETALKALPEIINHTPNVLYLVIGKTHPNTVKNNRDHYRDYLEELVKELKLENHVRFINRYLEIEELLEYLKATDVYLFTSKDANQAVSGTFAYAMSCACPIVATKIPHTEEVLTPNTGILIDIDNSEQLAKATLKLLSDIDLRASMALGAFEKTRESSWKNIALKLVDIYKNSFDKTFKIDYDYPPIRLRHIKKMTTELGIIQFSKISEPDISSGYTLDDNARALIAMCLHYQQFKKASDVFYIDTYLSFIERCQTASGTFINYVDENNNEHIKNDYVNLEDSNARAVWALGMVISLKDFLPNSIVNKAESCLLRCFQWVKNILSPRAIGFAIKGLYLYYTIKKDTYTVSTIKNLSKHLITSYDVNSIKNWKWFENYMTYANSVLPEAILYTYLVTGEESYKRVAIESFDFLLSKMFVNGHFRVISNKGWYQKDTIPKQYGEQPIDVSYTIQALDVFYKAFEDSKYKDMMKIAFHWFLGKNHLSQIMYDPITGGCYDGLEKENVNLNQGAESTVCYIIARLIIEEYKTVSSTELPVLLKPSKLLSTGFSRMNNH